METLSCTVHDSDGLYRRLKDTEIRLLRVRCDEGCQDILSCQLSCFAFDKAPPYFALSYVWGDAAKIRPVSVNGRLLDITENLYTAISYFGKEATSFYDIFPDEIRNDEIWIWADALCINQRDQVERAAQIGRMVEVYSSSQRTIVSLAIHDPPPELDVNFLVPLLDSLGSFSGYSDGEARKLILFQEELGDHFGMFLSQFSNLVKHEWFDRIWVVQEYVLSPQTPICVPGFFSLDRVETLYNLLELQMPFLDPDMAPEVARLWLHTDRLSGLMRLRASRSINMDPLILPLADQLVDLFSWTETRKATVQHDHVYGLLALTPQKRPSELRPDYNQPFGLVFQNYARYMIEHTGNLTILPTVGGEVVGFPSWVPDFRHHRITETKFMTSSAAPVVFSEDGLELSVRGVKLGCIQYYSTPSKDMTHGTSTNVPYHVETLREIENNLLIPSSKIRGRSYELCFRDWFEYVLDLMELMVNRPFANTDYERDCSSMESLVEAYQLAACSGARLLVKFAVLGILEYRWVLTDSGLIGHMPSSKTWEIEPIDRVWALKGERGLSIIRHLESRGKYLGTFFVADKNFGMAELFQRSSLETVAIV